MNIFVNAIVRNIQQDLISFMGIAFLSRAIILLDVLLSHHVGPQAQGDSGESAALEGSCSGIEGRVEFMRA